MTGGGFFDKSLILVDRGDRHRQVAARHAVHRRAAWRAASARCCSPSRRAGRSSSATPGAGATTSSRWRPTACCRSSRRRPSRRRSRTTCCAMKHAMARHKPDRVAIDSLTALQRAATAKSFREYLLGLSFHIKTTATVGMLTAAAEDVGPGLVSGELHVSTVSDSIIVLQYVASGAEVKRGAPRAEDARLRPRQGAARVHDRRPRDAHRRAARPASRDEAAGGPLDGPRRRPHRRDDRLRVGRGHGEDGRDAGARGAAQRPARPTASRG